LDSDKIHRETFKDLAFFYRDTSLKEELISKYKTGLIINELGFCDMSFIVGGLTGNLRFLIASNNGKDLSEIDPELSKFGFILLQSDSFYKILDVYRLEDKTQIVLLNISDNFINYFRNSNSVDEKNIISLARKDFKDRINSPIVEALVSEYWKERTEKPVGMYPFSMEPGGKLNIIKQ